MIRQYGPWITTAVFGLQREDGIAVVEFVQIASGRDLGAVLLLGLVRDHHDGPVDLRVDAISPDGEKVGELAAEVEIPDLHDVAGRVTVPIALSSVRSGTYWFEIRAGERLLSRVPLRVAVGS
jgi:hypothetical protein